MSDDETVPYKKMADCIQYTSLIETSTSQQHNLKKELSPASRILR